MRSADTIEVHITLGSGRMEYAYMIMAMLCLLERCGKKASIIIAADQRSTVNMYKISRPDCRSVTVST